MYCRVSQLSLNISPLIKISRFEGRMNNLSGPRNESFSISFRIQSWVFVFSLKIMFPNKSIYELIWYALSFITNFLSICVCLTSKLDVWYEQSIWQSHGLFLTDWWFHFSWQHIFSSSIGSCSKYKSRFIQKKHMIECFTGSFDTVLFNTKLYRLYSIIISLVLQFLQDCAHKNLVWRLSTMQYHHKPKVL